MPQQPLDLVPFENFEAASRAVLTFLRERLDFDLWMMTRTAGPDWIVLQAEDQGYGVKEGNVFRWADTFCSRMARGDGPRAAPNAAEVPIYAEAPIAGRMQIGAYIGVPVALPDGSLFGTLCAIDRSPQQESIKEELPLVEILAKLLGSI